MASPLHGVPVAPLTGLLDLRSQPDLMPPGSLRLRQNFQCPDENVLRRGCGWKKLLSKAQYNNQDLHDQLLLFGGTVREPITMIAEVESSRSMRTLLAATQSRILRLSEHTGNWQLIGSGLGGAAGTDALGPRFHAAVQGDYVILTNGYDKPKYCTLESSLGVPVGIQDIPDLALIGLTRAAWVWQWRNCVFLADVDMDAENFPYRVLWSDYNNPLSFDPSLPQSITGFKDLNFGERVLGFMPTYANTGLLYTNKGTWEVSAVGGDLSFNFRRVYDGEPTDLIGTLFYPNTLMNLGDAHLYAGRDRFYLFSPYYSRPEPLEWLHKADKYLFDRVREDACEAHVAQYHGTEAYISFVTKDSPNGCPDTILRVNMRYKVADIVDHGFSAFASYRPQDVPSIRDFILENAICNLADLTAAGYGYVNEGLPNPLPSPSTPAPTCFYTKQTQVIDGITIEDWTQPEADPESLCALVGDLTLLKLCVKCEAKPILVGASSQDWCLKEIGDVFYRERYATPDAVGVSAPCASL